MKKEIKFRAITREGIMIYNIGAIEFFTTGSYRINEEIPIGADKLMQFTGLKDKNGKEIYEGDIVNFGQKRKDGSMRNYEVKWHLDRFGMQNPRSSDYLWFDNYSKRPRNDELEVIGNIYENPELLNNN